MKLTPHPALARCLRCLQGCLEHLLPWGSGAALYSNRQVEVNTKPKGQLMTDPLE